MAKLHFRYGTMGSSKTANLLMVRFNYIEKGKKVWLIKPSIDTRDGKNIIKSRIGLEATADIINQDDNILSIFFQKHHGNIDVIIADECQFFTESHIRELRDIVSSCNIPVLCFGLRTDFRCELFPGSKALFALADEIEEIKSICKCGEKAIVNARFDKCKQIITKGKQIELGSNDSYESLCYKCYIDKILDRLPL